MNGCSTSQEGSPATITSERTFAVLLTACFAALVTFNVLHHAMWRDEMRVWQIAAASPTLIDLHANARFDGVPLLWYSLVWLLTKVTANPIAMQLAHVAIASGVVCTVAAAAPFSRWTKALFAFGYFPFFEYATISRNYALVFLLFLLSIAILTRRAPSPWRLAMCLILLSQASIWGAGFAGLMVCVAAIHWRRFIISNRRFLRACIVAGAVVLLGIGASYGESLPGPGKGAVWTWKIPIGLLRMVKTVGTIWDGWVPLPEWTRNFWNTNLLDIYLYPRYAASVGLLALAALCVAKKPAALVLLLGGVIGLLGFSFLAFPGVTRHHGHLFMLLIGVCWLARSTAEWNPKNDALNARLVRFHARLPSLFAGLMAINVISGIGANIAGFYIPFSRAQAMAATIQSRFPATTPLAGAWDYAAAPVAGYLRRPMYFPQSNEVARFNSQDDAVRGRPAVDAVDVSARRLLSATQPALLFVTADGFSLQEGDRLLSAEPGEVDVKVHVRLIHETTGAIVGSENMRLYLISR